MKTLLLAIVALFTTALSAIAQEEDTEGFVYGGGSHTTVFEDHTTTISYDENRKSTIATSWKEVWFGKWEHLKEGCIEPLEGNGSGREKVRLIDGEDWLLPAASILCAKVDGVNDNMVIGIRKKKGETCVLGLARFQFYGKFSDCFLLSLKEDSIKVETVARLLYDYAVKCKGEKGKALAFEKADVVEYINAALADNAVRRKMMDDAVKEVDKVAPVRCIGYNPESGAALFAHCATNFVPLWKDMAIGEYIEKESKGKYTYETIDQADAAFKEELRDAFTKQLDKWTK